MTVFILQNQHQQYLNKDKAWVDSGDATALFKTPHYDVALNQLIELNSKDFSLRGIVVNCELDSKGRPKLVEPASAKSIADEVLEGLKEPDQPESAVSNDSLADVVIEHVADESESETEHV